MQNNRNQAKLCLVGVWAILVGFGLANELKAKEYIDPEPVDLISTDFKQMYIVFAGPYPASPSSAFGHILLVFEPNLKGSFGAEGVSPHLWTAVNYAAVVDDHGPVEMLWFGLTGQLQGSFEVLPFYKKIREYSYLDAREIWLFPVQLNGSEKVKIIDIIQARNIPKPYRFTDKNCATEVADVLLETIGEKYERQLFGLPQDIIEHKTIKHRLGPPSLIPSYNDQMADILVASYDQRMTEKMWPPIDKLTTDEKVQLLKMTEWLSAINNEAIPEDTEKYIRKLRMDVLSESSAVPTSILRKTDFSMHKPTRVGFLGHVIGTSAFGTDMDIRLGLHDFIDYQSVYPTFDYLNFLHIRSRFQENQFRVEELWLLKQESRFPSNELFSFPAWDLAIGGTRYNFDTSFKLMAGIFSGVGKTVSYLDNKMHSSVILGTHFVASKETILDAIIQPKIEQYIMPFDRFRMVVKVSNPLLISDYSSRYLLYEASVVLNLDINSSFIVDYSKHKELTSLRLGMKFNIGI